jgi:hypothetical protein
MIQRRRGLRGAMALCVLALGCSSGGERVKEEDTLTERPPMARASLAEVVDDAALMTTEDDAAVRYLGIERRPLSEEEREAVFAVEDEEALRRVILPLSSPAIPESARAARRFTLITERGPIHTSSSRGVLMSPGLSEPQLYYVCDIPAGVEQLKLDMLAVPYDATLSAASRVRSGERVAVDSAQGEAITRHVRALLAAQQEAANEQADGEPEEAAALDPARHIQIVRGKFGGGGTLLVAYAVPRSEADDPAPLGHFSGMLLTDEGVASIKALLSGQGTERIGLGSLVDLEGDGVDEARFWVSDYEARYESLLYFKGDEHVFAPLSGDGG